MPGRNHDGMGDRHCRFVGTASGGEVVVLAARYVPRVWDAALAASMKDLRRPLQAFGVARLGGVCRPTRRLPGRGRPRLPGEPRFGSGTCRRRFRPRRPRRSFGRTPGIVLSSSTAARKGPGRLDTSWSKAAMLESKEWMWAKMARATAAWWAPKAAR